MDVASLAVGLVEQALRLITKVRKAHREAKELPQALERRERRLKAVRTIIYAVQDEAALQTPTVTLQLKILSDVVCQIKDRLKALDQESSDKNAVSKALYQLTHGKADAKTLDDMMDDLDDAKSNLGLVIQLANIGVTKSCENSRILLADPKVITEVDKVLVGVFGEGKGLHIAELIRGRPPQDDGLIAVDKVDIASLYDKVASSTGDPPIEGGSNSDSNRIERIIIANTALDNSRMINAPLGEDMWKDLDVKIIGNETRGSAFMLNWPTPWKRTKDLLNRQDKIAAADRAERERKSAMDFQERKQIRQIQERKEIREAEERRAKQSAS